MPYCESCGADLLSWQRVCYECMYDPAYDSPRKQPYVRSRSGCAASKPVPLPKSWQKGRLGAAMFFLALMGLGGLLVRNSFIFSVYFAGFSAVALSLVVLSFQRVTASRTLQSQAVFAGEQAVVFYSIRNCSFFPLPYLKIHYRLPAGLTPGDGSDGDGAVLGLAPRAGFAWELQVRCHKRGIYTLDEPAALCGDVFGLALKPVKLPVPGETLVVYPKLLSWSDEYRIPAYQPFGKLKATLVSLEDYSNLSHIRDYAQGDPLRKVDWKATARRGKLQVKEYSLTATTNVCIVPDLNLSAYRAPDRGSSLEFCISWAATAAYVLRQKSVLVRLLDPGKPPHPDQLKKGADLHSLLASFASLEPAKSSLAGVLSQHAPQLPKGLTLLIVSPDTSEELFEKACLLKRIGYQVFFFSLWETWEEQDDGDESGRDGVHAAFCGRLWESGVPAYLVWASEELVCGGREK